MNRPTYPFGHSQPAAGSRRSTSLRWRLLGVICAAFALLLLAACGTPTPTPQPVALRFVCPSADADYYKRLAEQFKKTNPNITVELVGRRWDTLAGVDPTGADVILTSQFGLDELRRRGVLVGLDPLIAGDKNLDLADFLPNALKMFMDGGKTWALPAGLDPQVLYYNKTLFDARSVPYPSDNWTRDDFRDKTLKLRDASTGIYGYAVTSDFLDPILFVYQHGGRLFDDLEAPSQTTFTDPKTVETVEWWAKLLQESGAVAAPGDSQGLNAGNVQSLLRLGRAGMWIGPLSARGGRLDRAPWPWTWGMTLLPRDAQSATMATATGYAITTQCTNSLACWQFIAFLSKQPANSFAPVRKSLIKSAAGQDADVARIAQSLGDNSLFIRAGDLAVLEKAIAAFTEAVNQVVSGSASAADALSAAQNASPLP